MEKNKILKVSRPTWIDLITQFDGTPIIIGKPNGIEPLYNKIYNKKIKNMITAQVVLINPDGLVLGVSRKTDHNDFGLAGGKMEDQDGNDPMNTAIRETKEETGLDISNLRLVFAIHKNGNMGYTYLADYEGEINHNEPHIVKWLPFDVLINGSFGKYNKMVSESLDDMGIKYISISLEPMISELNNYVSNTIKNGYDEPFTSFSLEPHFGCLYTLRLKMGEFELDEEWDDLGGSYIQGIRDIGNKYGITIRIPSYYYTK